MSLQFMKAKLKMVAGMNGMKASKAGMNLQRVRSGPPLASGEIAVKFGGDFSPSLVGCEPKMEIKASLLKKDNNAPETFDMSVVLGASSVDAAKSACDALEACLKIMKDSPMPFTVSQSEHTVVLKSSMPTAMADEGMLQMGKNLAAVATSARATFAWSKDFDDITKAPSGPMHAVLGAYKLDGEVVFSTGGILALGPDEDRAREMPINQATSNFIRLMAGSEISVSLGYFEGQVKPLLSLFKNTILKPFKRTGLVDLLPDMSLKEARDAMMRYLADGNEEMPPPPADIIDALKCLQTLPELITGIDSMSITGLPGFDINLSLQNFNPFPLVAYMIEPIASMAKMVPKRLLNAGLAKKMSAEEEAKLLDAFKQFDKDGSGQIDLTELKAMVEELGGKMSEDEAAQAMKQLDKNNQGTCNFEEFKTFWSSKSGLGGYSSMALKFLKMKLQMEGMVGMGRRMFTRTRKPVNEADNTSVKVCCSVTPGMQAYDGHRMSLTVTMKALEGDGTFSPPKATVRLIANSAEAAGEVVTKANEIRDKIKELGMVPVLPTISQDDDKVIVGLEPPEEMFEMMQMLLVADPDMEQHRKMGIELNTAMQACEVTVGSATTLDDWISSPDTPYSDAFKGMRSDINLSMNPQGKQAFLSNMVDMGPSTTVAKALIRAFAGAEIKISTGFHSDVIKDFFPLMAMMIPTDDATPESLITPAGMRDLMKSMAEAMVCPTLGEMPLDEMPIDPKLCMDFAKCVLERMKGIESVSQEASLAPTAEEKCTRMETTIKATDLNIFLLAKFLLSPTMEALMAAMPTREASNEPGRMDNGIAL
eukprot:TRINITY_DN14033_c0_g1_i1.p1 TRINITY_DN14033_c0_g1~~TRINITY_DN14033_c0_g1_i1.p1  ORF type:complete len:954 (-),score=222.05 TRINITY_DN14033_c0_g1_i1:197-2659(-)